MAPKVSKNPKYLKAEIVTNNYVPLLVKTRRMLISMSCRSFMQNLTLVMHSRSRKKSARAMYQIWSMTTFNEAGDDVQPTLKFQLNGEHEITPSIVMDSHKLSEVEVFSDIVDDNEMKIFLQEIGYKGDMTKMVSLTRPNLRGEWSFSFDFIGRDYTAN